MGDITSDRPVAYFCAEYGLEVDLPLYAGGLGVLAGDTVKEAGDQNFPMVALGLLYRGGKAIQKINMQGEQYPSLIESPLSTTMGLYGVKNPPISSYFSRSNG